MFIFSVYFEEVKYVKTQREHIRPFTIDNYVTTLKIQNNYQSKSVVFERKKFVWNCKRTNGKQFSEEALVGLFCWLEKEIKTGTQTKRLERISPWAFFSHPLKKKQTINKTAYIFGIWESTRKQSFRTQHIIMFNLYTLQKDTCIFEKVK